MGTDPYVPIAQCARLHPDALPRFGILRPKQVVGKLLPEALVDFADPRPGRNPAGEATRVDPRLNGDVGFGFKLEMAPSRLIAVVVAQSPFDVNRMGIMSLNEVGVVAIHGPDEIGQGGDCSFRQAAPQPR